MTLSVRGLEGLKAQLQNIAVETQPKLLRGAMRSAFKRVQDSARAKVPVDSGALHAAINIGSARMKNGGLAVGLVMTGASNRTTEMTKLAAAAFGEKTVTHSSIPPARRWHFIEFGTARQAPKPFLRPAIDENAQGVVDELGRQIRKRIQRAAKKGGAR